MNRHQNTFMNLDELGTAIPEYNPNYDLNGTYIDSFHEFLSKCPVKDSILIQLKNGRKLGNGIIQGWLRREDALKLYELAYFAKGDILELGSYHGLSTTILSKANQNSPYKKKIYSIDLEPEFVKQTNINLKTLGLNQDVYTYCEDATHAVRRYKSAGDKFEFVFIDHSHSYGPVYDVCQELDTIMLEGGFCLFHDFNDNRNSDPEDSDYGVYQAVIDGLDEEKFEFYGIYGCTGLYRFK